MSLNKQEKSLIPDSIDVSDEVDSPYIDDEYIGDRKFLKDQIMERFDNYKLPRSLWDGWIYEATAMYIGQQNMWWNAGRRALEPVQVEDVTRTNAINNRILNKCRAIVQRFVGFDPTSQAIPSGPSQQDIYSARMAKRLIQSNHADTKLKYKQQYERFAEFVIIQGMGWLRTEFDPHGGRCTVTYKTEPSWKEIQVEAQKENEGTDDELAEWLNKPMEELEENGELGNKEKGETESGEEASEGDENGGQESTEGGEESGTDEGNPGEDNGDTGENEGQEDNGQTGNRVGYRTLRVPELDDNGKQKMKPVMDEKGKPKIDKVQFDGCVVKRAVGPMNMYFNPTITQWEDAFDCIELQYLSIDQIRETYPGTEDIGKEDYEQNSVNPWLQLLGVTIDQNPYGNQMGVPVYLYFCKSCEAFPMGLKVVIIKDKIRVAIPMPTLQGSELPYDFDGYIPVPGTFRYMGLPLYLKNPQLIQNKLLSQYIDHARQFAVPKVVMQATTKLMNELTNGVEIVKYTGDKAPDFPNPQATSSAHTELIKYMDDTMDTNSGVNKTAEGNPPPNVTSGDMAEAITENDYQLHMTDIDSFAAAVTGSCNKEIRYMQDQGPDEVLVRYAGPGGKWMVDKFKKAVLRNVGDIMFIPGRSANMSRGQQRKDIELMLPIVTQGQGTPELQSSIIKKAMEHLYWGEEEALVNELTKQQNYCLDVMATVEQSANDPNFNPIIYIQPFVDLTVLKQTIEDSLLNLTEFNQKPQAVKDHLINLWQAVTTKQSALVQGQQQPPGGGSPSEPPPPPNGGPGGAPPQGAPQPGGAAGEKLAALQNVNENRTPQSIGVA